MRNYNAFDLIRFHRFANENGEVHPTNLLKAYNKKYPELSSRQKLINLAKALEMKGLYKILTSKELDEEK